ncbi:VOC family protein [Ruegeria atlantica]|uniref:VOC family protein n=1 Tax=Ruegeria atlantica TaxID=81569 RepID=UPI00147B8341|nr:VOC family protein [Ruegeria atlantica]
MKISGFDHIVLCVSDVDLTLEFYQHVLGMTAHEERVGKWSLHFGSNKISIQDARTAPALAEKTVPGSGNFCVVTETPIEEVVQALRAECVEIVEGPAKKLGAVGDLMSVYFRDPDGNLVEVSNRLL